MTEWRDTPPSMLGSTTRPNLGLQKSVAAFASLFPACYLQGALQPKRVETQSAGRPTCASATGAAIGADARRAVTNLESSFAMVPRIATGAGARRGDRLGISDCRRTVRGRLADRAQVDATTGGNRRRRGDRGHLARDQRRLALSGAAGHLARHLLRGVDRHRCRRHLPGGGMVFRRPLELRALAWRHAHHRWRDHAQARALGSSTMTVDTSATISVRSLSHRTRVYPSSAH